jgi:hypothetical protein
MPRYAFEDPETGYQFEVDMKYEEMLEFVKEHPSLDPIYKINFTSSRYTDGLKNDDGWKENLARIAEAHPDGMLAQEGHRKRSNKEIKTAEVIAKHRKITAAKNKSKK